MPEYQLDNQPTQYYTTTGQPVSRVTPGDRPSTPNTVSPFSLNTDIAQRNMYVDPDSPYWKQNQGDTEEVDTPFSSDAVTPLLCGMALFIAFRVLKNKISKIVGDFGKKH